MAEPTPPWLVGDNHRKHLDTGVNRLDLLSSTTSYIHNLEILQSNDNTQREYYLSDTSRAAAAAEYLMPFRATGSRHMIPLLIKYTQEKAPLDNPTFTGTVTTEGDLVMKSSSYRAKIIYNRENYYGYLGNFKSDQTSALRVNILTPNLNTGYQSSVYDLAFDGNENRLTVSGIHNARGSGFSFGWVGGWSDGTAGFGEYQLWVKHHVDVSPSTNADGTVRLNSPENCTIYVNCNGYYNLREIPHITTDVDFPEFTPSSDCMVNRYGSVGIGTYYPSTRLDVNGTVKATTFSGSGASLTDLSEGAIPTEIARKTYVDDQVAALVDSAPETLNTLNELASALGDNENFSTAIATDIGLKANKASPVFTGLVGIGTNTPDRLLHLKAGVPAIKFQRTSGGSDTGVSYITGGEDGKIFFNNDDGATAILDPNGSKFNYQGNNTKLQITATGIKVTGTAEATTFIGSGASLTGIPTEAWVQQQITTAATSGTVDISTKANIASPTFTGTVRFGGDDTKINCTTGDVTAGNVEASSVYVGDWFDGMSTACFRHATRDRSDYALLQTEAGRTILNSATGQELPLCIGSAQKIVISSSQVSVKTDLVVDGDVTGNLTGDVTGNADTVTNGVYTTGNQTIGGAKTFTDAVTATHFIATSVPNLHKIQLWGGTTSPYSIGMDNEFKYGGLGGNLPDSTGDYAMTFLMSDTNGRGWWWGDSVHDDITPVEKGAMALTTQGHLTIAGNMHIGAGESEYAAPPLTGLRVEGTVEASVKINAPTFAGNLTGDLLGGNIKLSITDENTLRVEHVTSGGDAHLELLGTRTGSTSRDQSKIIFKNYDDNPADTTSTHILGSIAGRVTDKDANIGDMVFYTSPDGVVENEALRITSSGDVTTNGIRLGIPTYDYSFSDMTLLACNNDEHAYIRTMSSVSVVSIPRSGDFVIKKIPDHDKFNTTHYTLPVPGFVTGTLLPKTKIPLFPSTFHIESRLPDINVYTNVYNYSTVITACKISKNGNRVIEIDRERFKVSNTMAGGLLELYTNKEHGYATNLVTNPGSFAISDNGSTIAICNQESGHQSVKVYTDSENGYASNFTITKPDSDSEIVDFGSEVSLNGAGHRMVVSSKDTLFIYDAILVPYFILSFTHSFADSGSSQLYISSPTLSGDGETLSVDIWRNHILAGIYKFVHIFTVGNTGLTQKGNPIPVDAGSLPRLALSYDGSRLAMTGPIDGVRIFKFKSGDWVNTPDDNIFTTEGNYDYFQFTSDGRGIALSSSAETNNLVRFYRDDSAVDSEDSDWTLHLQTSNVVDSTSIGSLASVTMADNGYTIVSDTNRTKSIHIAYNYACDRAIVFHSIAVDFIACVYFRSTDDTYHVLYSPIDGGPAYVHYPAIDDSYTLFYVYNSRSGDIRIIPMGGTLRHDSVYSSSLSYTDIIKENVVNILKLGTEVKDVITPTLGNALISINSTLTLLTSSVDGVDSNDVNVINETVTAAGQAIGVMDMVTGDTLTTPNPSDNINNVVNASVNILNTITSPLGTVGSLFGF